MAPAEVRFWRKTAVLWQVRFSRGTYEDYRLLGYDALLSEIIWREAFFYLKFSRTTIHHIPQDYTSRVHLLDVQIHSYTYIVHALCSVVICDPQIITVISSTRYYIVRWTLIARFEKIFGFLSMRNVTQSKIVHAV